MPAALFYHFCAAFDSHDKKLLIKHLYRHDDHHYFFISGASCTDSIATFSRRALIDCLMII